MCIIITPETCLIFVLLKYHLNLATDPSRIQLQRTVILSEVLLLTITIVILFVFIIFYRYVICDRPLYIDPYRPFKG